MAGVSPAARRPCLPCAVALSPRLTAPSGCADPGRPSPASPAIPRRGGGVDDDLHAKRHDLIQHRTQDLDLRYRQHGAPPVPVASGTAGSHHCPCRPGRTARICHTACEPLTDRPAAITLSGASAPSAIGSLASTSQPPVRTNSSQLPMPAAITAGAPSRPPATEAHPPRSFLPGHRSGECPLPASLTFAGRGGQPETGSCIVLPVDTAPCTSASTQLARSRSEPNAGSPGSLCLVRREA